MFLDRFYVAPRVGDVAAKGRAVRRARCGHEVYISATGLDAISRRGKHLICGRCAVALAGEQGARLGVWFPDEGDEPEAAA